MMARILVFIIGGAVLLALQDVLPKWALGGGLAALFCFTGVGSDSMDDDGPTPMWVWGARGFLLLGACILGLLGWLVFQAMSK